MLESRTQTGGVRLRRLLFDAEFFGAGDIRVTACSSDSRQVRPGDLFVAIPGVERDGHEFAREALQRGASAFLVERPVPVDGLPYCVVPDVQDAYGRVCQELAGQPSEQMRVIGITGTNGKTTTSHLAAGVLAEAGGRCGAIGTLGICDGIESVPSSLTTPPAAVSAHWLGRMVANGCTHATMEVSSHALSQSRVAGIRYDVACFTNMRRDHLDYHGSLVNYHRAKGRLLDHLSPDGVVILNADDPQCMALLPQIHGPVITVGMQAEATLSATVIERHKSEQTFLLYVGSETLAVRTQMIGDHHVMNCLMAAAVGLAYGVEPRSVVRGLQSVTQVPGRMERIECGQSFGVFVDYAHTPDALSVALATLRKVTPGRLVCVFGAGGDRDPRKRPLMGAAVEQGADLAIITTDNPRTEDPAAIAADICRGFDHPSAAESIVDRGEAICWALSEAREGDTVLIAGKGHENYQIVGRQKHYFDDREIARDYLHESSGERLPLWSHS